MRGGIVSCFLGLRLKFSLVCFFFGAFFERLGAMIVSGAGAGGSRKVLLESRKSKSRRVSEAEDLMVWMEIKK